MIDIVLLRDNPALVRERLAKLFDPGALERVDRAIALDAERRRILTLLETNQARRNRLNKAVGILRGSRQLSNEQRYQLAAEAAAAIEASDDERAIAAMNNLLEEEEIVKTADANSMEELNRVLGALSHFGESLTIELEKVEAELDETLLWIPNMPHDSVPVFESEEHNIPWAPEGEIRTFDFMPKPHWELGPALGIIDFERGVKLTGTRGYVLSGPGARLQRALIAFFLDRARDKGFTELYVPYLVKEDMMVGAGQFPKFRDNVYFDPDAELYLLPTAEVAITNLFRDEILDEADLPRYYVAHTPCFRREKISAGRDVRGIKRVHQFEKVEMYKFTRPETSYEELESLVEAASDICRALELPFRRLEIVTGDLGFSASKKYDLEIWSPGCEEWLEVSSCSNTEDFQARRANIKYRPADGRKPRHVHTLNGSGLATPRVLIAILENYQQADGSVRVPAVLQPYIGLDVIAPAG